MRVGLPRNSQVIARRKYGMKEFLRPNATEKAAINQRIEAANQLKKRVSKKRALDRKQVRELEVAVEDEVGVQVRDGVEQLNE